LIAGKHARAAVEAAKELHKRLGNAASEALLLEAYEGRIRELLQAGMAVEAKALRDLVGERFPGARSRLAQIPLREKTSAEELDDLLRPLLDPGLAVAARETIESAIRQQVADLGALARVTSLPATHPLREGAAALAGAFEAVTRGPVEDAILRLPQVSRHSPLASWKALTHAVAEFHRHNDAGCRKWLEAIAADSVPARLIAPLRAMLDTRVGAELSVSAQRLAGAVGSGSAALRPSLTALERAWGAKKRQPMLDQVRVAVSVCDRCCPELRETLRQHISIRCMLRDFAPEPVRDALGGPTRRDASFFRLMALGIESRAGTHEGRAQAAVAWEEFRRFAIKEKWFAAGAAEDGVLSLHMAELVGRIPEEELEGLRLFLPRNPTSFGDGSLTPHELLSADTLYRRASAADPHPETFSSWLEWAKKQRDWKVPDHVAELWSQACPRDVTPLLWLTESSEERSAFQKSLKYLQRAEELDRVNPEVRKTKARLLVARTLRHLRQRKPHLAIQGIEQIAALPELPGGSLAPVVSALQRLCAVVSGDSESAQRHEAELAAQMGNAFAAEFLCRTLARASLVSFTEAQLPPSPIAEANASGLLPGISRVCSIGRILYLPVWLEPAWERHLIALLEDSNHALNPAQMLMLGDAAHRSQALGLLYALSTAGLATGTADARFLFQRALALPVWATERRRRCLAGALELARRERDTDLAGRILHLLRDFAGTLFAPDGVPDDEEEVVGDSSHRLKPETLNQVLAEERAATQYPRVPPPAKLRQRYQAEEDEEEVPACDCPSCRRRKALDNNGKEESEDDEGFEEEEDDPFEGLDGLDPELKETLDFLPEELFQQALEALKRGESPEQILGRILFGKNAPSRRQLRRRNRMKPKKGGDAKS
jgi:hypothetical protein